jgi:hypothetical protein
MEGGGVGNIPQGGASGNGRGDRNVEVVSSKIKSLNFLTIFCGSSV